METQNFDAADLVERLQLTTKLRWAGLFIALSTYLVINLFSNIPFDLVPCLILATVVLIYNMLALLHLRSVKNRPRHPKSLALLAILIFGVFDLLVLACSIYYTGGIESPYLFLLLVYLLGSTIILSSRLSYLVAFATITVVFIVETIPQFDGDVHWPGTFLPLKISNLILWSSYGPVEVPLFVVLLLFSSMAFLGVYMVSQIMAMLNRGQEVEKRLLAEQRQALAQLTVLHEISMQVSAMSSLNGVLDQIVVKARELFSTDIAFLALREEDSEDLSVTVVSGENSEVLRGIKLKPDLGLGGLVSTGLPTAVEDCHNLPGFVDDHFDATLSILLKSGIAAPLTVGQERIGALYGFNTKSTSFDSESVSLLWALASQAAIAISNARLYAGVQRELQERERIEEVLRHRLEMETAAAGAARLLAESDAVDLKGVLAIIGRAMAASRAYAFCFSADPQHGYVAEEWRLLDDEPGTGDQSSRAAQPDSQGPSEFLPDDGTFVSETVETFGESALGGILRQSAGNRNAVVVPMLSSGEPIGFLGFEDTRQKREWSEADASLMRTVAQTLAGYFERRRAEARLIERERRYRDLADSLPQLVFETDASGMLTFGNRAGVANTGYAVDDLRAGLHVSRLVVASDGPRAMEQLRLLLNGESVQGSEYEARRKDGSTFPVIIYTTPLWREGQIAGIRGIAVDITEHKIMEAKLRQAQKLEMAGAVAGQVAHDFNNLLGPLVGFPDLIKAELPPGHPAIKFCDMMVRAGKQMADINADLLTLGRRGLYNQELVNLNLLIQEAAEQIPPGLESLTLELDLAKDLPPTRGAAVQLHRVLSNLFANAREAMQEDGTLKIKSVCLNVDRSFGCLNQLPPGRYIRVEVTDSGGGIPDEIKEKIFDPFFTTKNTGQHRGSGLGLSVVQAIVKDHHGYVDVTSESGRGATFRLYLPVEEEAVAIETSGATPERRDTVEKIEAILVVDDYEPQRIVLTEFLTQLGYKVDAVSNGEDAIVYLQDHPVDLLALDMVMPGGIDGTETFRRALEIRSDQRAIVISGFAESDRVREARRLGVTTFLTKPVTYEALETAVRKELDRQN